ncbi:N-ethylmaleimide reductase [Achromobacter mucicolens]|uniref:alkene reductase n=1 Tax=Achromobacter mucicolens TaxID=1389922 RepID=UPI0014689A15|nr:alkene reductase [Achromobacter mucicolens]CAB3851310.1 N-ethylmaleimide reductase [Achromobacter mucicolens]
MSTSLLFTPYQLGALTLPNRLVMAPMTRSRAQNPGKIPTASTAIYYAQRASAGLIISEGSQISPQAVGYIDTPGIHSGEQVSGWKRVTEAVHAAGGRIFSQLWHVGAVSHPYFHNGELPVAPSAVKPTATAYTGNGMEEVPTPRALETHEVKIIVEDYRQAAKNAQAAGFDGVEIHGANGFLIDQFLQSGTNVRTDEYGGNVENRARFALEVVQAAVDVFGAGRVGYKMSPSANLGGISDADPRTTFSYLAGQLDRFGLAYLHVMEALPGHFMAPKESKEPIGPALRKRFTGPFILNGGYDKEAAEQALAAQAADLISFGVPFIANPDLVARYHTGAPLSQADPSSFYGGTDQGYIDYPPAVPA